MKWLLILLLFTTNVLWAGPNSSFGLSPTLRSGLVAHWTMNDAPGYSYAGPFDMVAWYKMDEGSGTLTTADSSGNGNTGSLINSPAWTNGVVKSALKFNGANSAIGTSLNLSNYLQITYCAWIKLPSLPSAYKMFVTTDGAGGFGGFTLGIANDNRLYASGNNGYAVALNAAVANTWYFVCGSATNTQSGKILLYINGVIDTAGSSALITSVGNSTTLNIGRKTGPFTPIYIDATIDDVRIYNRALSASEIANIYNTEVGNYTTDSSGNGNTGYLTNSPAWTNGVVGSALKFDGSTTAIGTSLNLSNYSQITYCAWIKLPSLPSAFQFFATTDGGFGNGGFSLGIGSDNRIYASSCNGYSAMLNLAVANTWYFVCGSATNTQSGKVSLYINGVIDTAGSSGLITLVGNSTTLNIGKRTGASAGSYTTATIDDVRIYNRALSSDEILKLYNGGYGTSQ